MSYTAKTKIRDLKKLPPFFSCGKYLVYAPGAMGLVMENNRIEQAGNSESLLRGLKRLEEASSNGFLVYPVYRPEECVDDKRKKDVNVIFLPKTQDLDPRPFMVICAGGAYAGVNSITEGFPVAARFNELGYDCFVFTYRVGGRGRMPDPVDDLAAALRFILENKASFRISDTYALCGFSAGANLICLFGTDNLGYQIRGLPGPVAMVPVYPLINFSVCGDHPIMKFCLKTMFGSAKPSPEKLRTYNVDEHMNDEYPPCYIVCGKNDSLVPPANSERLKASLDRLGIPAVLEEGEDAEHGFGEGIGTSVEGWIDRADAFIMGLKKEQIS